MNDYELFKSQPQHIKDHWDRILTSATQTQTFLGYDPVATGQATSIIVNAAIKSIQSNKKEN